MNQRFGILATTAAYLIWGASPLFWNRLQGLPALELLSWRVLFALLILGVAIVAQRRLGVLWGAVSRRPTLTIAIGASCCLMVNWGLFVWSATHGHIVDVSLGYAINPLMSVGLGVFVLGESLTRGARAAVGLAAVGVGVVTFAAGEVPWIPLLLASSFAVYGLLKKQAKAAPPTEGLAIETALAMVPLGAYLAFLILRGQSAALTATQDWDLLPYTGLITVVPLLLFGVAAQRTRLSTIGMLQFIAPALQLLVGIMVYGEGIGPSEQVGFGLVWVGATVYAIDTYLSDQPPRNGLETGD